MKDLTPEQMDKILDATMKRLEANVEWMHKTQLFDRYEDRRTAELNPEYEDRIKEPNHG